MTDRQTDRQTDGRPGKNNMSPDPKGGRHNIAFKDIKNFYKQLTVNYLLNPGTWTRPKVNTERSQMNNTPCKYYRM